VPRQDRPVLTVTATEDGSASVLAVAGELDLGTAPALRDALLRLLERDEIPDVVLDASGVTFADSSGLGVLLMGARRWAAERRSFALHAPSPPLARLLDLAGVRRAFSVVEDDS
jgi:anti-sigma B factor antagonist